MRNTLVAALVSCAERPVQTRARRFLGGLSSDELQFIAEFLGCCILEATGETCASRAQLANRLAEYQEVRTGTAGCRTADQEHKLILLLEYLCRCGLLQFPLPARAGQVS